MSKPRLKFKGKDLCNIIIVVLVLFVTLNLFATKIIYDLTFPRYDGKAVVSEGNFHLKDRRVQYTFPCGNNRLKGYLYSPQQSFASKDTLVVIIPGYRSNTDHYLEQIKSFSNYGKGVFIFDTTGSGESGGDSSVGFSQVVLDLNSALEFIEQNNFFGYKNLVLFGHSRGGYAACCALRDNKNISAVVSVSGLNSAMEATGLPATRFVGPLAYLGYPFLYTYQSMLFGNRVASGNAAQIISENSVPVLIIHGEEDDTAPIEQGSIISHRDEITSDKVEFFVSTADGQDGHTDILFDSDGSSNDEVMEKIENFLEKNIKE